MDAEGERWLSQHNQEQQQMAEENAARKLIVTVTNRVGHPNLKETMKVVRRVMAMMTGEHSGTI